MSSSTCPHCPGSSKLFVVPRGLNVHISRVHKDLQNLRADQAAVPPVGDSPPSLSHLSLLRSRVRVLKHIPKGARNLAAAKLSGVIEKCIQSNSIKDWYDL